MRILLNLVGAALVSTFLLYLAFYLNEAPLYVVCGLGIVLMLIAMRQDHVQDDEKQTALRKAGH